MALDADGAVRTGEQLAADQRVAAARRPCSPPGRTWARVVHTHSPEATAVGLPRPHLPAVHYVVAWTGGRPCRARTTPPTARPELAANVVAALGDGGACLMANHGLLTVAPTLDRAVALAADVEWLARVHRLALALGEPVVLPDDEIARVADRFRTYGQPLT